MSFKKLTGKIHLILGFVSGLVVFVVALTGSLLVFEHEIEETVARRRFFVEKTKAYRLPVDVLIRNVQAAYPNRRVSALEIDEDSRKTIRFWLEEPRITVFVDPYTGKTQGDMAYDERFFTVVLKLHRYLLAGEKGKVVTGISCVIFIVMLLTGLMLWWPRNVAFLREKFRIRWQARWRRVNYDVHSVAGFYASVVLLIIAATGLVWSYKPVNNTIFLLADGKPQDRSKPVSVRLEYSLQDFSYEQILTETNQRYTFLGDITISLPQDDSASITVAKEDLSAAIPNVVSFLYFDQYSGQLLKIAPYETVSRGMKIRRAVYPIHTGSIGGIFTKLIAVVVCLFAASLPITGFLIWWGRRRKNNSLGVLPDSLSKVRRRTSARRRKLPQPVMMGIKLSSTLAFCQNIIG